MSRPCSSTGCLPLHPARSPPSYRGVGDDLAMLKEDAMTLLHEQRRGRFQLPDHFDGPAHRDRDRAPGILVVEDHPELHRELLLNLRARHYDVTTARTGRDALALATRQPPSKTTQPAPATCSPNPAWATATSPTHARASRSRSYIPSAW